MTNKLVKRCSTSSAIRASKSKLQCTTAHLPEWLKFKRHLAKCWHGCRETDHSYIASRNIKWYSTSGNRLTVSQRTKHNYYMTGNCTLGHLSERNENLCSRKKSTHKYSCSFICNSPRMDVFQKTNGKPNVDHPYHGII